MKNIYILINEDSILSSVAAPIDIFTRTNHILLEFGKAEYFKVELVSSKDKAIQLSPPTHFSCNLNIADLPPNPAGHNSSLIIIPAFSGLWPEVYSKNRACFEWLVQHYGKGTELASLCVGSYFLAEAGLLNGKTCTSHWRAAEDMRSRFPLIDLQSDKVITDENGIYTGGGAFSSLNLLLYLVEKFCGHEIGIAVAKNFSIHRDHISQAHFSAFNGLNQHGDSSILKAQTFIEKNFQNDISIEDVANTANTSKRNLIRRFKQATQLTPLEYIQKVKIEAAKNQLEHSHDSIQTIMYAVGYNDSKTFREIFKRQTGVTPQNYRLKYGRHI